MRFFVPRTSVPPAPSRREVDPRKQRRKRRAIDRYLRLVPVERRKLEAPGLETLREQAPARAVEPQGFGDPSALVEEQIDVAIDWIQPKPSDRTSESVERAAHIERSHGNEYAHRRRKAQHERRTSSTRRSVAAEASSPNSNRTPPTSSAYRPLPVISMLEGAATSSTSARAVLDSLRFRGRRRGVPPPRSRFMCQACSERPSTPCARAHSPRLRPSRFAATTHRRASLSSSIFFLTDIRDLQVAIEAADRLGRNHPAVADGSRNDAAITYSALLSHQDAGEAIATGSTNFH